MNNLEHLVNKLQQTKQCVEILSANFSIALADLVIVKFYTPESFTELIKQAKAHTKSVTLVGELSLVPLKVLSEYFDEVYVQQEYWVVELTEHIAPQNLPETGVELDIKYNFNTSNPEIYILTLKDNAKAESQLAGCTKSITDLGLKYNLFYGYDGTKGNFIETPEHLKSADYMRWIKVLDPELTVPEIACALGHIALWAHCITINKPVIVLEHDALMLRPLPDLSNVMSLEYLGHRDNFLKMQNSYGARHFEQALNVYKRSPQYKVRQQEQSDLQLVNKNFGFCRGLHAYAISPLIAKKLFGYVLENGLVNPADVIPRIGLVSIAKTGVFGIQAYNADHVSTISNIHYRAKDPNSGRKSTANIPGIYNTWPS